ncbi:MAG: diguanylate cyclase [Lachnospiraceae bacterium]|nr:diguanylate cyclase [Lachnospiraceae bacterium]
MNIEQIALNQIATSLAKHFDSLYYIEIKTGYYTEFLPTQLFTDLQIPKEGEDFFELAKKNINKSVHPGDVEFALRSNNKETVLDNLSRDNTYSVIYRLVTNGKIVHIRHIYIMCEDRQHIMFCLENIEDDFREKEEHHRNLQSAQLMARRDELTGIKNKNAFIEYTESMDEQIRSGRQDYHFGIVMCDLNDLKLLNDTRGHSFGDEAIQRTSRMICDIYKHSPVFRVGGDEFVVVLTGEDYQHRDDLLEKLQMESLENKKSRSGPVVAGGMSIYDTDSDKAVADVLKRADDLMYENKKMLKSGRLIDTFRKMNEISETIPNERRRQLDALFGALVTVTGKGYIYLNDMRYDFSRWSLSLIDDFGLHSEYMYHADSVWKDYIHPDDMQVYDDAVNAALCGEAELKQIFYRARKRDGSYALLTTRAFVLNDENGEPEYFGGIILQQ